jgi:RNA polymerase sigma-70 factor
MSQSPQIHDIDLVQKCLDGDENAQVELRMSHDSYLRNVLQSYRAGEAEIDEILAQLWLDCLLEQGDRPPLLQRYNGRSALRSWLSAIVTNRWLSLMRRQTVHNKVIDRLSDSPDYPSFDEGDLSDLVDVELMEIIEGALRRGFAACTSEEIVMLHLVHLHQLTQREVASLWGCHESYVSRRLKSAEERIAEITLETIRAYDPLVNLNWTDFLRLCETTNSLFR